MINFFISDLHISNEQRQIVDAFYHFVEHKIDLSKDVQQKKLYILGDFFDRWIGDDEDDLLYVAVKEKLREYSQRGLRLYFVHGNRDFLLGQEFARYTGMHLLNEITAVNLCGRKAILMHGDSLCTRDEEYMQFRRQVRDPQWQRQILALPLEHRRELAQQMREKSSNMNSNKAEDIMDVTPEEVVRVMSENNATLLIHGHTHRPAEHELSLAGESASRVVLGDWHKTGWYAKDDGESLQLKQFDI